MTVSSPGSVCASPTLKRISADRAPEMTDRSVMLPMVGAVFAGGAATVTVKLLDALAVPSLTATVTTAVPVWPAAGMSRRLREGPNPPKEMLPFGTRTGLEDEALTVSSVGTVSPSYTLNPCGAVITPGEAARAAMGPIAGGLFVDGFVSQQSNPRSSLPESLWWISMARVLVPVRSWERSTW